MGAVISKKELTEDEKLLLTLNEYEARRFRQNKKGSHVLGYDNKLNPEIGEMMAWFYMTIPMREFHQWWLRRSKDVHL
jgi:hypothetical protein